VRDVSAVVVRRVPPQLDVGFAPVDQLGYRRLVWLASIGLERDRVRSSTFKVDPFEDCVHTDVVLCVRTKVREVTLHAGPTEDGSIFSLLTLV